MAAVSAAPMPPRLAALRFHLSSSSSSAAAAAAASPRLHPLPLPSLRSSRLRSRSRSLTTAHAVKQADTSLWTPAPVSAVSVATADGLISYVVVDLSDAADLAASYTTPGQYLKIRVPAGADDELKPAFMAIASPPGAGPRFEFVVKTVPGTTAERLCALKDGDVVELGAVMGNGFALDKISPPDVAQTVLMFATGTGISTIRSLIEFGFAANERADVRLYYGARSLQSMAYQERFKNWESTGVKVIPVLSRPDDSWNGERGHVQDAFYRNKNIVNPSSTGAVLCGQNEMQEEITSVLVADGVSRDKILTNY